MGELNLETPETWRWIWAVAALAFAGGEVLAAAPFFFAPLVAGALAAALFCLLDGGLIGSWTVFGGASVVTLFGLRLSVGRGGGNDRDPDDTTGWIGRQARVVADIDRAASGPVRLHREEWRARALDYGPLAEDSHVVVVKVVGTRLVVVPVDEDSGRIGSLAEKEN